jgi:hypothetical protein
MNIHISQRSSSSSAKSISSSSFCISSRDFGMSCSKSSSKEIHSSSSSRIPLESSESWTEDIGSNHTIQNLNRVYLASHFMLCTWSFPTVLRKTVDFSNSQKIKHCEEISFFGNVSRCQIFFYPPIFRTHKLSGVIWWPQHSKTPPGTFLEHHCK